MTGLRGHISALGAVLVLAMSPVLAGPPPDDAALRGRQIYEQGTSPGGGEILALIGSARIPVAGSAMRCARCHGEDGTGRAEGGISPSNLTWPVLTRRLEASAPGGRTRPAYDEAALKRAISMGVDPAGRPLNPAMPRFQMGHRDMADLIAWLRHLGAVDAQGVEDDTLVVGTLLPPPGDLSASITGLFEELVADVSADGGIYGRQIAIRARHAGATEQETLEAFRELVTEEQPLVIVAPYLPTVPAPLSAIAAEHGVPVIGPLTFEPGAPDAAGSGPAPVFYLLPGRADRARALARRAIEDAGAGSAPVGLLAPHMTGPRQEEMLAAMRAEFAEAGTPVEDVRFDFGAQDAAALVARLRNQGVERLLVVADELELLRLLAEVQRAEWDVELFLPSLTGARAVLDAARRTGWRGVVHAAVPVAPGRRAALAQGVVGAWSVLVEVLRRAGSGVSRQVVIAELENLYEYRTEDLPPVSFDANRRQGIRGAWIISVNAATGEMLGAPGWRGL